MLSETSRVLAGALIVTGGSATALLRMMVHFFCADERFECATRWPLTDPFAKLLDGARDANIDAGDSTFFASREWVFAPFSEIHDRLPRVVFWKE